MNYLKKEMVSIATKDKSTPLSREQKTFNQLTRKINEKRKELLAWQEAVPAYQKHYTEEFMPLSDTFEKLEENLVYLLDKAYSSKIFTKSERQKMRIIICGVAGDQVSQNDNEKLKTIYNKYSGSDIDEEMAEENEMMKSMMEDILGIDLGDEIDFRSPDEAMETLATKIFELKEKHHTKEARHHNRKKSHKTLEKEKKQQEEEVNISQSIREVYRKLASALHPDRAQDELEQSRRDELMQRVNVAYAKKDLLQLLELQLEIEQIDQNSINNISKKRLKHYNKVLSEQFSELESEVMGTAQSFLMRFNLPPPHHFTQLSPEIELQKLQKDIEGLQKDITSLEKELSLLKDTKNLRTWLKKQKIKMVPDMAYY